LETVGDIDILAACEKDSPVMERFIRHEDVRDVVSHGPTRSIVHLRSGLQVDLRGVPEESYGAALHYFTGSKAHNIAIRKLAQHVQLKVNEYGVFRNGQRIAGQSEEEIFARLGLQYIAPELREMRGEIEAARENRLPKLIVQEDILGDLHAHTNETDGHYTLAEMVQAARERGYQYLAITDHSQRVTIARGMDEKRLRAEIAAIDNLNSKLNEFTILKGLEVDILNNRLNSACRFIFECFRKTWTLQTTLLDSLSPLAVLCRGYSISRTLPEGRIIRDAATLATGDSLEIQVFKGRMQAEVTRIYPE